MSGVRSTMEGLANTGKTVLVAGLAAGAAAVAGLAAGLTVCVQAAAEEQVGIAKLGAAVTASGGNWDEASIAIEAYLVAQTKRAALDDGTGREALSRLTTATGSYQEAMELLPIAMDLAAAKGIDLSTASELVGKVANGNTAILTRYGITLEEGATAAEALAAIQKTFAGQAEAYGNTMAGQQAKIGIAFGNLKETIGAALLPVVTNIMEKFSTWATDLMPKLEAAIAVISPILTMLAGYFTELVSSGDPLNDYLADLPAGIQPIVLWFGNLVTTLTEDVIPAVVSMIVPIKEFIVEHADAFKNALIAIGAVLAGAAIVGGVLALVAAIAALANPVTAVIVAVGLLAAAWTEDWGGIRTTLTEWWENTGKRIFAEIEKVVGELVTWFEEHLPAMIETVTKVMADIKVIWDAAWPPIERALKATWETMKSSVETIITLISGVISTVMAIIDGDWTTAWKQIKKTVVDVFEDIKRTLGKALDIILALFNTNLNDIGDKVETGFSGVATSVEGWMTTTSTTVSSKFAEIKESLGTWLGGMQTKASEAAAGILEALQGPYAAAKAAIADPGGTLDSIITALPGLLTSAQTTIQGFGSGILNSLADPYRQAVEFLFGAEGLLPGLPGKITANITNLVTAITDKAEGIKTAIMQPFKDSSGGLFGEDGIFVNINKAMGAALLDLLATVTGKAGDFYDAAVGWAGKIKDGFIGAIEGRIAGGVSLATEFAGAVKGMINHLIDAINESLNDIYVGTVLGKRLAFNAPDIPHLAGGVIGFGGGLALVGENGPEVVQLPRGANVYTTNNYNINANYAHQGERSLRSDIRFLQLVGAI